MSRLNRQDAMRLIIRGLADDVPAFGELQGLLASQFSAALRHQGLLLGELAERISTVCDGLEQRRRQRVQLVELLLGPGATPAQAIALLHGSQRDALEAQWQALEGQVLECRRLAKRNSSLLVDQYGIMQRVLHGEEQTYAPR